MNAKHYDMKKLKYDWGIFKQLLVRTKEDIVYLWQPGEVDIPFDTPTAIKFAESIGKELVVIRNRDWYHFWACKTVYHSDQVLGHNTKINKCFTCLNGKKRSYRSELVDLLAKEKLIKNNYVSLNLWDWSEDDYQFKYRPQNKPIYLDKIEKNGYWNVPSCFKDSLFSVVTETHVHHDFITEKTWLPIYHKRPFVVIGNRRIHQKLKELGFELFEEYFDYEAFEDIGSMSVKLPIIVDQLKNLQHLNFSKERKRIQDKLEYNHDLLVTKVKLGVWLPKHFSIEDGPHSYLLNTLWT